MTVYVVQDQRKLDRVTGEFVSKFDLSSAEKYGTLSYLLGPTAKPFLNDKAINQMHVALKNYQNETDYLLLIGNPALIGMVVGITACYSDGNLRMLQWSGKGYTPIFVEDLFRKDVDEVFEQIPSK